MKRLLYIVCMFATNMVIAEHAQQIQIDFKPSNINIQKITNSSKRNIFVSFERVFMTPMQEEINISGHIMPGYTFKLIDPEGIVESIIAPVWQHSFRGPAIHLISLSGNPGLILYLYVIGGHLWGVYAPHKQGDFQGIHLLKASDKERNIELVVKDNNIINAIVLDEHGKRTPIDPQEHIYQGPMIKPTIGTDGATLQLLEHHTQGDTKKVAPMISNPPIANRQNKKADDPNETTSLSQPIIENNDDSQAVIPNDPMIFGRIVADDTKEDAKPVCKPTLYKISLVPDEEHQHHEDALQHKEQTEEKPKDR